MKVYLAGERHEFEWLTFVKRRLFSYYYNGQPGTSMAMNERGLTDHIEKSLELGHELFLDSGAFTAFTKGVEIPLELYAEFVNRHPIWSVASSLDAIGKGEEAAAKSWDNFQKLCALGADVRPVFHVREPDEWLRRYVDAGYKYILLGGMVAESSAWLIDRLDHLWSKILCDQDGFPKVQVHGFGLTTVSLMFRYPWYSVDSASWLMASAYGNVVLRDGDQFRNIVFSEDSGAARKADGWHYNNLNSAAKHRIDKLLEPFGVPAKDLGKHYIHRCKVNAATYQQMENLAVDRFVVKQQTLFG